MNTGEKFDILCKNLTVQQKTRITISYRYILITNRLNADFWSIDSKVRNSLYVGSYGRQTAVRGFSDLDIIFKIPYHLYDRYDSHKYNGQSALLQTVKNSLKKTYPSTHLKGDGQIVSIKFKDGIEFEILPAFEKDDNSFLYPDSNNGGRWKSTNPIPEIESIKINNLLTNNNLVNLCRMTRAWRNKWNVPIGGLLIDTLANQFLTQWEYKHKSYFYYDFMVRDFFSYLSNQNPEQLYWKALGSGQYIHRKGSFENKAKQCYNLSVKAIELESKNFYYTANLTWMEIYGSVYPKQYS